MSSGTIRSAKAVLRKEIKQKLAAMTESAKQTQSKVLTQKLLSLEEVQSCHRISLYLSMKDEVETTSILKSLLESNKNCFIPHYSGPNMKMVPLYSWDDYVSLPETKWKIKQPKDDDAREDALDTGGLDVIVMPGLGFSTKGARLGRGKGYYDSYLAKCESKGCRPFTVALAFQEQIYDSIPVDINDKPIDLVLFPELVKS